MGKVDLSTQKFKRKSKIDETQSNEEALDMQNRAVSDFGPLLDTVPVTKEECDGDKRTTLRKPSLCSSDTVEETLQSVKQHGLDDKLSDSRLSPLSLFADSNIEILQPSQSSQCENANKTVLLPSLAEELEELPHSEVAELCQSDALALYLCKVWKADSLLLVVFVSNKNTSALKAVNVVFEKEEHFQVRNFPSCFRFTCKFLFHVRLSLWYLVQYSRHSLSISFKPVI